ncbi:u-box domain-containing protein 4 [Hordeum vulgare]|nr:u-box domain-containing protein 4 [Hordeum vulgare]
MSTHIAPFAGSGIDVFNSCVRLLDHIVCLLVHVFDVGEVQAHFHGVLGLEDEEVVAAREKGKEVVSLLGDDMVVEETPNGKRWNEHYHEEARQTHLCEEFKLKTNTVDAWRVKIRVINDMVTLDQGCPPPPSFTAVHEIKINYMVTFKMLTSDILKVIISNDDDIEVVTKCKKHEKVFAVNI